MKLWCAQRPKCLLDNVPLAMFEYFWSVFYFCVDGRSNSITASSAKNYCTKHLIYHKIMVCTTSEMPPG